MSVKEDKTPIYQCPICFSPLYLDDPENDLWRCTNPECVRTRDVVVHIEISADSAQWAWYDEQKLKAQMSKHGGSGRSGKRRRTKKAKRLRWYIVDRSVTERNVKHSRGQDQATEGTLEESEDPGIIGGDKPQ